jgi:hypothetical protein
MDFDLPQLHVLFQAISDEGMKREFFHMCLGEFAKGRSVYTEGELLMCGYVIMPDEFYRIAEPCAAWFLTNCTDMWGKPRDAVLAALRHISTQGVPDVSNVLAVNYVNVMFSMGADVPTALHVVSQPNPEAYVKTLRTDRKAVIDMHRTILQKRLDDGDQIQKTAEAFLKVVYNYYHRNVYEELAFIPNPSLLLKIMKREVVYRGQGIRGPNDPGGWFPGEDYIDVCRGLKPV